MGGAGFHGNGAVFCQALAAPAHTLTRGRAWGSTAPRCRAPGWEQSLVPGVQALHGAPATATSPGTGTGRNPAGLASTSPPWGDRRHLPLARCGDTVPSRVRSTQADSAASFHSFLCLFFFFFSWERTSASVEERSAGSGEMLRGL